MNEKLNKESIDIYKEVLKQISNSNLLKIIEIGTNYNKKEILKLAEQELKERLETQ